MEIHSIGLKKEYFVDLYIQETGKNKICFTNIDGSSKILAFDFMEADKKKEAEVVTKGKKIDIFEFFKFVTFLKFL